MFGRSRARPQHRRIDRRDRDRHRFETGRRQAALLFSNPAGQFGATIPAGFDAAIAALAADHAKGWANDYVARPERLATDVLQLLVDLRLAERMEDPSDPAQFVRLLPAAGRFLAVLAEPAAVSPNGEQAALW